MTTNKNAQAASTPPPVNYATLQADVADYIADLLERTRHEYGETDAEADVRIAEEAEKFRRAPWVALLWYAEHMAPKDQLDLINDSAPALEDKSANDDDFNPVFRDVEMDGEIVTVGNTDACIQMAREGVSIQARALTAAYDKALSDLKITNGAASGSFAREEAWKIAMASLRFQVVLENPSQAATQ